MHLLKQLFPEWSKVVARRTVLKSRQISWRSRSLPDFLIVGAQKSGTTSLYHYLGQHSQLLPSYEKEIHYFDAGLNQNVDNYRKGEAWYRAHFPLERDLNESHRTFEASPLYLFNPLVAKRISLLLPNIKIVAVLRNPTERAISQYFHSKRENNEPLTMMAAMQAEKERLKPIIESEDYKNEVFIHNSYKSRGLYYIQIQEYLKYFSMPNILILSSEELFSDPAETLRRVFRFVGVDPNSSINNLVPRNVTGNRTEVDREVYSYLDEYFQPHNQKLYELIQDDFGW